MPEPENPKPRNPRANETAQKPQEQPHCHIHDEVWKSEVDNIREKVCVPPSEYLLTEFEGKYYCLFHLPTKDKDIRKFEEVFQARLRKTDEQCAAIKAEFPDDDKKQKEIKRKRNVNYDFRYVWFPQIVNLMEREFSADAYFSSATFSSAAYFRLATFRSDTDFSSATFSSEAYFRSATFNSAANFSSATFSSATNFSSATFSSAANFSSATFSSQAYFRSATFSSAAHFKRTIFSKSEWTNIYKTNFEKDTYFDEAEFNYDVIFNSTIFGKDSVIFFRGTFFAKNADFQYCTADGYLRFKNLRDGKEVGFDFQNAAFEKANRIEFHTCHLRPSWFVNIDSRKFELTEIKWEKSIAADFYNKNITDELASLYARKIFDSGKRLLEIACRQLAVNAEENNRFEEASKFRYMAMETRRLENKGVWRFLNLHWFYKWSSGYGESWSRAAVVLLLILFSFGVLYFLPVSTFDYGEKKPEISTDKVERQIFDFVAENERFRSMNLGEGIVHSLYVSALQRPDPKPADTTTRLFVILETIFAPLQAALLALAIRRKFMR